MWCSEEYHRDYIFPILHCQIGQMRFCSARLHRNIDNVISIHNHAINLGEDKGTIIAVEFPKENDSQFFFKYKHELTQKEEYALAYNTPPAQSSNQIIYVKGETLESFLSEYRTRHKNHLLNIFSSSLAGFKKLYYNVPYEAKGSAKKQGYNWDPKKRKWWIWEFLGDKVQNEWDILEAIEETVNLEKKIGAINQSIKQRFSQVQSNRVSDPY